jgi:transposase
MSKAEELTEEQWGRIEPLLPRIERVDGRGRPRFEDRAVMNGIFWILRTGAPWADLERFPSHQTCYRRFQEWVELRTLKSGLEALAEDLRSRGKLDLSECFIDGTFVVAKKGGSAWERPSGPKVRRSWWWQTALVFLSPYTLHLLLRMKSPLFRILSKAGLSPMPLND